LFQRISSSIGSNVDSEEPCPFAGAGLRRSKLFISLEFLDDDRDCQVLQDSDIGGNGDDDGGLLLFQDGGALESRPWRDRIAIIDLDFGETLLQRKKYLPPGGGRSGAGSIVSPFEVVSRGRCPPDEPPGDDLRSGVR